MSLPEIAVLIAIGTVCGAGGLYLVIRALANREPYASFLRLRTLHKVRFFRLLVSDPRVPFGVKALPFLLLPYLAMPFDLIPDFIPVLGYLDDVAVALGVFALVIKLTPRSVIEDLFKSAVEPS